MKNQHIVLSENNIRAKGTGLGIFPLVVVEPGVSGNTTPCKAVFKINSTSGSIFVGVCIPSIVSANGYRFNGNFHDYEDDKDYQHGTFMIGSKGDCYTHDYPGTKAALSFEAGQSVEVKW